MELVNRDGATFFVAAGEKDNKITTVRKWEQAFRVYATIYSRANPARAAEVWQYIYTVNLAASSYIWEKVASYNYTFRQLMSQYPGRSWATLYHQLWSLTMRDSINTRGSGANFSNGGSSGTYGSRNGGGNRDHYCWKFNRNKCRFGSKCKFEHCCFYCDAYRHGSFNCPQKNRQREQKEKRNDKWSDNRDGRDRQNGDVHRASK